MRAKEVLLAVFLLFAANAHCAIVATHLTQANNGASFPSATLTTSSISPTSNALILISVAIFFAYDTPNEPTSVTGNGITYTLVTSTASIDGGSGNVRYYLYRGLAASPTSGAVTITGHANTKYITTSVDEITGIDIGGTNGANAIVQSGNTTVTATSMTITLSAFASASNRGYGAAYTYNEFAITPGSGFTEIHDGGGGNGSMQSEIGAENDNTVDWTFASNAAAGMAVELKAAAAPATDNPSGIFLILQGF